jgi:uncharacterized Fe-S cluster protein YjdI
MDKEKTPVKQYKKDDLTIIWDANKCIHAGECVKLLPGVYDPKARPWIKPENATVEELKNQIKQCPSGALTYQHEEEVQQVEDPEIKIHARMNGSLLVEGNLVITKPDGTIEKRNGRATFCRCGHSENMPFCDGAHKKAGFNG